MTRPLFLLLSMYFLAWAFASRFLEGVLGTWWPWAFAVVALAWASRTWRYLHRRARA